MIRVLIADDHGIIRQGLNNLLAFDPEIKVVGLASDGVEALEQALELKPDVVLMDLMMPNMDGFVATAAIRHELPKTAVLVLTGNLEHATITRALQAGANGFVLKNLETDELCQIVKNVSPARVVLSNEVAQVLAEDEKTQPLRSVENLTERETEVLGLLAQGLANKEIAQRLQLSEKTIKTHVSIILAKLGIQSRTQAAIYATQAGLAPANR
jgi:DNA-binding NarL/FixJ family response regulator